MPCSCIKLCVARQGDNKKEKTETRFIKTGEDNLTIYQVELV